MKCSVKMHLVDPSICICLWGTENMFGVCQTMFETNRRTWFLRIKNFWCINALLKFAEFESRYPSKPEVTIIMESFNSHFKDPIAYDFNHYKGAHGCGLVCPLLSIAGPCDQSHGGPCTSASTHPRVRH